MVCSFAALQMQLLARGWLVYQMTASPLALGIVTAGWGLPMVLFSLPGGAVADRVSKIQVIMLTEALMGAVSLVIAILIAVGAIQLWHLVAAAVFTGTAFAFNIPARQAIVPSLVGEEGMLNAYALNMAGNNLMRIVAPAAAGLLVAIMGVAGVYFLTVGLYGLSTLSRAFITLREEPRNRGGNPFLGRELMEGLRFIFRHPVLPYLLGMTFAVTLLAMPYVYLLPIFATDILLVGAPGLGWLTAMVGVGALAGALWVASMRHFHRAGMLLLGLAVVFGLSLALFSLSRSFTLSLALMLGVGVGNVGYLAVNQTLVQLHAAPEVRGRVSAVNMMTFGFTPLGVLPISVLAEVIGAPLAVGAGAVAITLLALGAMAFVPPLRRL